MQTKFKYNYEPYTEEEAKRRKDILYVEADGDFLKQFHPDTQRKILDGIQETFNSCLPDNKVVVGWAPLKFTWISEKDLFVKTLSGTIKSTKK